MHTASETALTAAARGDATAAPGGDTAAAPNSTDVGAYVASEPMQSGVGLTQRKTAVQLPLIQMGRTYPKKDRCPAYWHITASQRKERSVASKSAPLLQRAEACKRAPLLQALARGLGGAVGVVDVDVRLLCFCCRKRVNSLSCRERVNSLGCRERVNSLAWERTWH
jgi:hypothetical protein